MDRIGLQVESKEGSGTHFYWILDELFSVADKNIPGVEMSFGSLFSPRTNNVFF